MTNTEAIAVLKKEALFFKEINRHEGDEDLIAEALDMAIFALELQEKAKEAWDSMMEITQIATDVLEQKPCEDAISRQAVINAIENDCMRGGLGSCFASYDDAQKFRGEIEQLPSVTQKSGKWIMSDYGLYRPICDKCGAHPWKGYIPTVEEATEVFKYCPNCGACMKDGRTLDEFIEDSKESEE